jgi:phasin
METMTTKATKTPIDAAGATYESIVKSLSDLQSKFELPEAAREFLKRSAATAKDRATDMHAGANKVTGMVEGAIINTVTQVADINRELFALAHEDAQAAFAAVEKLAGAKSLSEAYQLQVDYLRDRAEVGMSRAKNVAEFVSEKATDGMKSMQDGFSKVANFSKQAA